MEGTPKLLEETNKKYIVNELVSAVEPFNEKTLVLNHYGFVIGYPSCRASFGNWMEQHVTIRDIKSRGVEVRYSDRQGRTVAEVVPIKYIYPHEAVTKKLLQLASDPSVIYSPPPQFNADDIVYIRPHKEFGASNQYPCIGSDYETDAKIHEIILTDYTKQPLYRLYSPTLNSIVLPEYVLVRPKDRLKYVYNDFMRARLAVDASPFFKLGECVYVYDNTVHNTIDTVTVPLTKELRENLIIEQE